MTAPEMSALLKSWSEVASKREMAELRIALINCRDILDGLLDIYPQYVLKLAPAIRGALAGMNQSDDVLEVTKAFEEKMKGISR